MRWRTWLVLSVGFGTLVLLIGLLGFGAMRRAQALHNQTVTAHQQYLDTEAILRDLPADLYLGDVLIRDYLLDPSHIAAPAYRAQLLGLRLAVRKRLDVLTGRLNPAEDAAIGRLRTELNAYWESMNPIFSWSPQEKTALSGVFLRRQVLPRRDAVVALAHEVSRINAGHLRNEQQRLEGSHALLQAFLLRTELLALGLGLVVAVISIARVISLEQGTERHRVRAESAEEELRGLSRQLVRAQEEERRSLSRELHDAIGQMLSAMTLELGNLETMIGTPSAAVRQRLNEARTLNAETIRGVRDLAMGLRPSMLDELGLGPALRWQGREFSRRSGVPVTVQIEGDLEELPETHRTCIYRVVQEALTNCAKHAQARNIWIAIHGHGDAIRLSVEDDGAGFERGGAARRGLGLIGIEERVRELDGIVWVESKPGKGTTLKVRVPLRREVAAE